MAKIILKNPIDFSLISNECKNELEKYSHQSKIGISFEILDFNDSELKMK